MKSTLEKCERNGNNTLMGNVCCCSVDWRYARPSVGKYKLSEVSSECSSSFELPKLSLLPRSEEKVRVFENTQISCKSEALIKSVRHEKIDSSRFPLASCLLSNIPDAEKANFIGLFLKAESFISREKVLNLFKNFFEVAVDFLPTLALESRDSFSQKEILNYQNILRTQKLMFVNTQVSWVMSEEALISIDKLLDKLRSMDWLLTPRKLRENILNSYITIN